MWLRLRYAGACGVITGKQRESINLPRGTTIGGLLDKLSAKYGSYFANRILNHNKSGLRASCRLFIGQEDVSQMSLDTPIRRVEGGDTDVTLYFLVGAAGG